MRELPAEFYMQEAERTLQKLELSMKQVETLRVELAGYYCEDESTFLLVDAFKVIRTFCDKLQKATKVRATVQQTILYFSLCFLHCVQPLAMHYFQ